MKQNTLVKPLFGGAVALALAGILTGTNFAAPERETPKTPVQVPQSREVATLAAGCFWSMEAIYEELKGVDGVEPGYAGGQVARPSYEQVGTGKTGHAETVSIVFDPKVISYSDLLYILLTMRDPTTRDRQGPDAGTNYRSAIFFHSPEQQKAAQKIIEKVTKARVWKNPIVTQVTPFTNFYRAEDYHRDYFRLHPDVPYSKRVIAPKVSEFRAKFKSKLKS